MEERLQKILAQAGVASRRGSEKLIEAGRVAINGRVVTALGTKADPRRDTITVDGAIISQAEPPVYIILHKPPGVLSAASDERGRTTVVDLVDAPQRIYPVGRLDLPSEGLILLTNDGELTKRLTHPRYGVEKEYRVLVRGQPSAAVLERWRAGGIEVDGRPVTGAVVELLDREGQDSWLRIVLTEGRKREIREVGKALGHPVKTLRRLRIGPLRLGDLKPGQWRHLTPAELARLKQETQ